MKVPPSFELTGNGRGINHITCFSAQLRFGRLTYFRDDTNQCWQREDETCAEENQPIVLEPECGREKVNILKLLD